MSAFTCDYSGATPAPSPNFGERAGGRSPDILLLHYTGMATADGALKWRCVAYDYGGGLTLLEPQAE